jgi:hypothetical protein
MFDLPKTGESGNNSIGKTYYVLMYSRCCNMARMSPPESAKRKKIRRKALRYSALQVSGI